MDNNIVFATYEEFAAALHATFAKMMTYSLNEIGSTVYLEKLQAMEEAYPEWTERAEDATD